MTAEQRKKTKEALNRYGTRQWSASPANWGWVRAIQQTQDYYRTADPIRAELLQSLPNVRQHSSKAPSGIHIFYLTTCKK